MGCSGSTNGSYCKTWWYNIRPQVPVGEANRGKRAELFAKLDKDKSGAVGPNGLEEVSSTFHLNEVCDRPVELLTEVYTATVGTGKLMSANMESFVERLRDAFDMFTMVYPEKSEVEKPVCTNDVNALMAQFALMNYEWPATARESWSQLLGGSTDVTFLRFLRWALMVPLRCRAIAVTDSPKFPLREDERYARDIMYAMMNDQQTNRLPLNTLMTLMPTYWHLAQYKPFPGSCRRAFELSYVCEDKKREQIINRHDFFLFLRYLSETLLQALAAGNLWKRLATYMPHHRSAEQLKIRDTMYAHFDADGAGKMSLPEARAGCAKAFSKEIPGVVTDEAVKTAFYAAAGADGNSGDAQFVERNEFRVFLADLHDYCQLRAFLDSIPAPGNPKTSQIPAMEPFWVYHSDDSDACAADVRKLAVGDDIPFGPMAMWWIKRRRAKDMLPAKPEQSNGVQVERATRAVRPVYVPKPSANHTRNRELWKRLAPTVPRQKTPEESVERDALFVKFDGNGTGRLSVTECISGIDRHLELKELIPQDCLQRASTAAFFSAANASHGTGDGDSTIERVEFRLLLCYVYDYCAIWLILDSLTPYVWDVPLDVFEAALPEFAQNGFVVRDPDASFAEMGGSSTQTVPFDTLVKYAIENGFDVNGARRKRKSTS